MPVLGNFAYPLQILYSSTAEQDDLARFMLYEREFPDSVAASVQSVEAALERIEADPRDSAPLLRVRRMLADLDFRARASSPPEAVSPWLRPIQQELERLDAEIHDRYFK